MTQLTSVADRAPPDQLLSDLRHALRFVRRAQLAAWATDAAKVTGRASFRRARNLAEALGTLARNGQRELASALAAARQGSLADHGQQRGSALFGVFRKASDVAKARAGQLVELTRDPERIPEAVVLVVAALVTAGGVDGDGGLPDLDLELGIGAHRSVFSHSIIAGSCVEGTVYAMATLVGLIYRHLPQHHASLWDVIEANRNRYLSVVAAGVSTGLAYHLLVDASVQPGAFHGLPVSMTMEGHQALMGANAIAEGIDVTQKAATFGHRQGPRPAVKPMVTLPRPGAIDPDLSRSVIRLLYGKPGEDEATAFQKLKMLAQQGDPEAQFRLAESYREGLLDGAPNESVAAHWFLQAAERGHAWGQIERAKCHMLGLGGVPIDHAAGIRWIRLAANQGEDRAQYVLGLAYLQGFGVAPDIQQGIQLLRLAADQGEPDAAARYGGMLFLGEMLPMDRAAAAPYLTVAAAAVAGNAVANYRLGMLYLSGEGVAKDLIRAKAEMACSAVLGNRDGMFMLAELFAGEAAQPADAASRSFARNTALYWYNQAAEAGNANAMAVLGAIYAESELGVAPDFALGVHWFTRGAASGSKVAMQRLASAYRWGKFGLSIDTRRADELTARAQLTPEPNYWC